MNAFRMVLIFLFILITTYTIITGINHGWDLFSIFFHDIVAMTWSGQFNLDFLGFLILSALWISWRNHFSVKGVFLGCLGLIGGMFFLSLYLLWLSIKTKGNIKEIVLGKERVYTS